MMYQTLAKSDEWVKEYKRLLVKHYLDIEEAMQILKEFRNIAEYFGLSDEYTVNCYSELIFAVYFTYISHIDNMTTDGVEPFIQSLIGTGREIAGKMAENYLYKLLAGQEKKACEMVEKIRRIIQKDPSQELSVVNLARRFSVTPDYLSHIFKKHMGTGCYEYIMQKRIEMAKSLLENTDMAIREVAAAVGYQDTDYFSMAFKRQTGQEPLKYRNTVQSAEKNKC